MPQSGVKRRLTAIMAADVVGYSRLMGEDETGTLDRLKSVRREIVQPAIADCNGRIVKLMGDGLLAEFPSVVEAVQCAVTIQESLGLREPDSDESQRIRLRIGINLGDILVEGSDIYGDGVNVAARLEGLANPGGICISDTVRLAMGNKLPLEYEFMGEQSVKNIKEPISVYQIQVGIDTGVNTHPASKSDVEQPKKPTIAVLPFTNMSGDPEQEYFADGVVEDIITDLSRFKELVVIARNSSFSYKGKLIKIQEVARDLGVSYVVEGSIRRDADRLRITAQLINASDESHLWGERYDREPHDIFSVQDEIVETIVRTIVGRVERHGMERAERKVPQDLQAYDYVMQARAVVCDSAENNSRCRELYELALHADPHSAEACSGISMTHGLDQTSGWSESPQWSREEALRYALKSVALDQDNGNGHQNLGARRLFNREYDLARFHLDKALLLNPNNSSAWAYKGLYLIYTGNPRDALSVLDQATRRNPFNSTWYMWFVGLAYYCSRRYHEAILPLQHSIDHSPKFIAPRRHLAACYAQLGKSKKATEQAVMILELDPYFSIEKLSSTLCYRDSEDLEHYLDGLRKAGLPD